jgi:hypothetical protein
VYLTWPLAAVFFARLGGDYGDPYQTLWSMRWMRDALFSLRNPFFTTRLHHPHGATLVFQTFDVPSAVLVAPLWGVLPPVAVYNTAVLAAFALTAYGMYRLALELTGERASALATGVVFAAVPYHLAHLKGHLHLISMGWVPLYLVTLVRMIRGTATRADAVAGGLFLALASLASWYHLVFAALITLVLVAAAALGRGRALVAAPFMRRALVLAAVYLALAGPLLAAIFVLRAREEMLGAHDPVVFSADLYAFVFPNAAQGWASERGAHYRRWSGNSEETAVYVGAALFAAALAGAWVSRLGRAFLLAAVLGAVLALGPHPHLDGRVLASRLPYWYLERLLPPLAFMGVPVRFGYVMYLGLCAAAAFALARLRVRGDAVARGAGLAAVLVAAAVVLYEYRPRPLFTWAYPVPAPMVAWGRTPDSFAVLDVSDEFRQLWHGTIHRQPMIGGYLSRAPRRLEDWMRDQPVIRAVKWPELGPRSGLGRDAGRAALRDLGIRWVVTGERGNACVDRELELDAGYVGDGVRIYEVPQ